MTRGIRVRVVPVALSLWLACLPLAGGESTLTKETSLRSEPGAGERTAFLTPQTPVEVLDVRDGWVRVRIEGWVPADAVAGAAAAAPTPPPVASPPEPATSPPAPPAIDEQPAPPVAAAGAAVEGIIKVRFSRIKKKVAAGAAVMLVPADVNLAGDTMAPEAAKRLADLEAEAARLQKDIEKAMQMSNFTEATRRRDEIRSERDAVLEDRLRLLAAEHGRHEHRARTAAVASGIADSKGFFRIDSVPPGAYTLYARMALDDVDLEWIEPLEVGSAALRLDLDETRARGMLPAKK